MREIYTEILIQASIEKIWSVLLNFDNYSTWNPFIRKIEGKLQINEKLIVTIEPPGQKEMKFYPKLLSLSDYQFKWLGKLWLPGIFDGTHQFTLIKNSDNQIKFIQTEIFSGFLHKPIYSVIQQSTKAGFENMNRALKQYCEN